MAATTAAGAIGSGSGPLHLTDDSKTAEPVVTAVGHRYNIVTTRLNYLEGTYAIINLSGKQIKLLHVCF